MNKLLHINTRKGLARRQAGMTYVELIVVLGIFAVMSTIVIFNYGVFQDKIDVKNLASQIGLKIVEAQNSALNGKWNSSVTDSNWKPSYGVYFHNTPATDFIYFADKNNDGKYTSSTDDVIISTESITKGTITDLKKCDVGDTPGKCQTTVSGGTLSITFTRPNTSAVLCEDVLSNPLSISSDHIEITVTSPRGSNAYIDVFPSGRVKIN